MTVTEAELGFKMMWIDLTSRFKFMEVNAKSLLEIKGWAEGEERRIDCIKDSLFSYENA